MCPAKTSNPFSATARNSILALYRVTTLEYHLDGKGSIILLDATYLVFRCKLNLTSKFVKHLISL